MSFKVLAKSLCRSLRQRRLDRGQTQSDLDADLGVATGLIAKWEGGFRSPTGYNLYCWAQALGCDLVLVPRPERENAHRSNRSGSRGRAGRN